jgi:hypothetical protein
MEAAMAAVATEARIERAPLPNRVDPLGRLFAGTARGTLMGNRGGRFHVPEQRMVGERRRPWASRHWIACELCFKGRQREVWGTGYTELFFLDEVTALAAGHRPCFECRRVEAEAFRDALANAHGTAPTRLSAEAIDETLHLERIDGRQKRLWPGRLAGLPDGTVILTGRSGVETPLAIRSGHLYEWTARRWRLDGPIRQDGLVSVVTPPSVVAALARGYRPRWHDSALAPPVSLVAAGGSA